MASGPNYLTDEEKVKIRYHLGYLNTEVGGSISLGIPSASQLGFVLENTMNRIIVEALPLVRRCIRELDCIEDQLSDSRPRLPVKQTSGVTFNPGGEQSELESQYSLWAKKLSDIFGAPINPFSLVHQRLGGEMMVIEPQ